MSCKSWKPRRKAPRLGQYHTTGPCDGKGLERTTFKDGSFPPTLTPNRRLVFVGSTRTKSE